VSFDGSGISFHGQSVTLTSSLPFIDSTFFSFSLFESSQSLFWASFGMVGLENFELLGIKTYTRFWGLLMFGSYSVINVIVLLNLLIAMVRTVVTVDSTSLEGGDSN
jgi:hypothetical protein